MRAKRSKILSLAHHLIHGMREGQFIQQNNERWSQYEQNTEDPDELAHRFTYLVDDLSYAKTFYPQGNTVKYLNGLAANIYLSIYRNKKEKSARLLTFWTEELPIIMYRHRRILLYAFLFFLAFVILGIVSGIQDQEIIRAVLGDEYVDLTEANIANGDPFNIYKDEAAGYMFVRIAINNIGVAFKTFMAGILGGVGSIYLLFSNGLMMGVFEYMFIKHNLGVKFVLVVFIHGTLELSAIVIAGMAGLVLGNSILFPGTYTRLQSLIQGAKDGTKIVVGLIPVFILAAFFESYITRHTDMPLIFSIAILLGSLSFILYYFVYYPAKVVKRQLEKSVKNVQLV